jgi:hypothetical protein
MGMAMLEMKFFPWPTKIQPSYVRKFLYRLKFIHFLITPYIITTFTDLPVFHSRLSLVWPVHGETTPCKDFPAGKPITE